MSSAESRRNPRKSGPSTTRRSTPSLGGGFTLTTGWVAAILGLLTIVLWNAAHTGTLSFDIATLTAGLAADHPVRAYATAKMELLERLGHASSKADEG